MSTRTQVQSACRLCPAVCGTVLSVEQEKIIAISGDKDHPISNGFICSKGVGQIEDMVSPDRILQPLRRNADGVFEVISLASALDEIAEKLRTILATSGGNAIAQFNGTNHFLNVALLQMLGVFAAAIGSHSRYSTQTIDQSCHAITFARMGGWNAGRHKFDDSDVALFIGTNPLVSCGAYSVVTADPIKRLKAAKQKGFKLIVIDPRRTETARLADCHLQPMPGADAAIVAALVHVVLAEGWHDAAFCAEYVDGLDALIEYLAPFTPDAVAGLAGIGSDEIVTAARLFAKQGRRGIAICGTGASMGPMSNLTDHLAETLNAICGRYYRAGEKIFNPPVIAPDRTFRAEVIPACRSWETSPVSANGYGQILGEFPSSLLAEDILSTGPDRIRALFVNGGNPAVALPDQRKALEGLRKLDLLVAIEPFMTATAQLCHYILPPKLMYERPDLYVGPLLEAALLDKPFAQYLPLAVPAPAGAEVVDDWYPYWALASRLGLQLEFAGVPLDMNNAPSTEDLLKLVIAPARIPLADFIQFPGGKMFDENCPLVLPRRTDASARLTIAPPDVLEDISSLSLQLGKANATHEGYRLIVSRARATTNSSRFYGAVGKRNDLVEVAVHPTDMARLGLAKGDEVEVVAAGARIFASATPDTSLREGVVSMIHCRGGLPDPAGASGAGSTSLFIRVDGSVEAINAMPTMTNVFVDIRRRQMPA